MNIGKKIVGKKSKILIMISKKKEGKQ